MAIFRDQPISLEAVKGVSPERFVQRAEREQQAIVGDFLRMQQGIQAGIQEYEQKKAEKQNMEISLRMLKEMGYGGMSDDALKAGIKSAGGPMQFLEGITKIRGAGQVDPTTKQKDLQSSIKFYTDIMKQSPEEAYKSAYEDIYTRPTFMERQLAAIAEAASGGDGVTPNPNDPIDLGL
jgi:hypothetical protein